MDTLLVRRSFDLRGDSGAIGRTHHWQVDVQPIRDDTQIATNWDINQITLRMRYPDGERDKLVELKTFRIQKKKSQ
jgi:hypothetical protein